MLWFVFVTAASFIIYLWILRPKLMEFRVVAGILAKIDAQGLSFLQRLGLRLLGMKTTILGMTGVLVSALPGLLEELHQVDFGAFLSSGAALKITSAITLAMTVTHIYGIVTAAKIDPVKGDE